MRNWLNSLTMSVPDFPPGDVLSAIENVQVLIRKWTVRKDDRAQLSVLITVCVAQNCFTWDIAKGTCSCSKVHVTHAHAFFSKIL